MWSGSHWVSQFTTYSVGLSEPVSCSASHSSCGCSLSLSRNNSHGIVWQRTRGQNRARQLGYRSGQLGSWVLKAISGFHSVALPFCLKIRWLKIRNSQLLVFNENPATTSWSVCEAHGYSVTLTTLPLYNPHHEKIWIYGTHIKQRRQPTCSMSWLHHNPSYQYQTPAPSLQLEMPQV